MELATFLSLSEAKAEAGIRAVQNLWASNSTSVLSVHLNAFFITSSLVDFDVSISVHNLQANKPETAVCQR